MKTVKFVGKDKSAFAATLKKNVHDYFKEKGISTKGNWTLVVKSILLIAFYIAPFVLLLTLPLYGWVVFPFAVLMGLAMAGIGMAVMHEAAHGSAFKKRWVNKLFGRTIYLMGSSAFNWKVQHNVNHHTFTNIDGFDEDMESPLVLRFSEQGRLRKMHRFQYIYFYFFYSLMTLTKFIMDFVQLHNYNKKGVTVAQNAKPKREYAKKIVVKVVYLFTAIVLPSLITDFAWWQIVLGFIIVHLTAGLIMSLIFNMAHLVEGAEQPLPDENLHIENEWVIHQLQTTANFARHNRVLNWFVGGLNFQIEHHLFPNICHIHYPDISLIVEKTANEFGIPYNSKPSFAKAVGSHIRILKGLGRK